MQLSKDKFEQLYPKTSNKIWFLNHTLDNEKALNRCIKSVKKYTDNIVIGVDDRTPGKMPNETFRFTWQHDFSYAKNLCLKEAMKQGLEYGDWVLFMGADFELKSLDMDFINGEYNFFGQFDVPESKGGVTRRRKLLWRHHPFIFWERLVHEEAVWSAYRLTGLGIPFGTAEYKEFPVVGEMVHYGFEEDGGEESPKFWRKKCYYLVLWQIDYIMYKLHVSKEQAIKFIYNNETITNFNQAIEDLVTRYMGKDIPQGLITHYDRIKARFKAEYD